MLAFILALSALAVGGVWRWRTWQTWKASPHFAVDSLNKAIQNKDVVLFAQVVNCRSLADSLAKTLAVMPLPQELEADGKTARPILAKPLDETNLAALSDAIQQSLLSLFHRAEAPEGQKLLPVPLLPDDFLEQLAKKTFVLTPDTSVYIAESAIQHPEMAQPAPVRLLMGKYGNSWRITRLLNEQQLVEAYHKIVVADIVRRKKQEGLTREENRQSLARYLPDAQCQGWVSRIEDSTLILALTLQTKPNPGPETLDAWGFLLELSDADGHVVATPRVTASAKIQANNPIEGNWTLELSAENFSALQAAGTLSCRAKPEYIILSTGKIFKDDQL